MKFVIISDTHGFHRKLKLPDADVIIHCGDFCHYGNEADMHDFLDWYKGLNYQYKIFIAGNHDTFAAKHSEQFNSLIPDNVTYLNDSGLEIENIKIWGSPVQPDLVGWAFGKQRGKEMKSHWDMIPQNTDLLITHTPPFEILDKNRSNKQLGCEELKDKLSFLNVKVHVFGHIHANYGILNLENTLFINASNYNSKKGSVNPPVIFELS